jgi:hypothetical protein
LSISPPPRFNSPNNIWKEVSSSGWSLFLRSHTECGLPECDREASIVRIPWPTSGCCPIKNNVWRGVSVIKLLTMQFLSSLLFFPPL